MMLEHILREQRPNLFKCLRCGEFNPVIPDCVEVLPVQDFYRSCTISRRWEGHGDPVDHVDFTDNWPPDWDGEHLPVDMIQTTAIESFRDEIISLGYKYFEVGEEVSEEILQEFIQCVKNWSTKR